VGTATLCFGYKIMGDSPAAGVLTTAFAFGLVLFVLVHGIGSISGAHVNPAVTLGVLLAGRMRPIEAVGYWVAQIVGGIIGAGVLLVMFHDAGGYSRKVQGLGADGWGRNSLIDMHVGGAFLAEVVLTALFVYVVLAATRKAANPHVAAGAIGLALTTVHIIGIPVTGTSVNPARSFGPAVFVGGDAIRQVWLFFVAPLLGGALAAILYLLFYRDEERADEVLDRETVAHGNPGTAAAEHS
jgi:aquaporin Z